MLLDRSFSLFNLFSAFDRFGFGVSRIAVLTFVFMAFFPFFGLRDGALVLITGGVYSRI